MKKLPSANGEYDIKKVREFIVQLDELVRYSPKIDSESALMIISNLIESLRYSVNTIEYLRKEAEFIKTMQMSGSGSNAKN